MLPLASTLPEYTVTEVSLALKKMVETGFSRIRVKGEISGLKRHTSGHVYFALKDQDSVLDAVCWRGSFQALSIVVSSKNRQKVGVFNFQAESFVFAGLCQ